MMSAIPWSRCVVGLVVLGAAHGRAEAGCPIEWCGTNSPYVNDFPVNGASIDGQPNPQGVRLVPESLVVARESCQGAVRLGIENGAFVGENKDGVVVCRGHDLIGAKFSLEMGISSKRIVVAETQIEIAETRLVRTWDVARGRHRTRGEWVRAYRFQPVGHEARSICRERQAWVDQLELEPADEGLATDPEAPVPWAAEDDFALLVVGELYDGDANVVDPPRQPDGSDAVPTRWFNIACQGSAIAKMRLLGYDPTATVPPKRIAMRMLTAPMMASSRAERQSTLKMITCKYCGRKSHTIKGVKMVWRPLLTRAPRLRYMVADKGLEAFWGPDGAVCLTTPRMRTDEPLECELARCADISIEDREVYWASSRFVDRKADADSRRTALLP